ncbi:MAG TPA: glycosyltransferase [Vicinamibacterales bacterium]|nr:glycosyltransferase [Vicinamibacterales bacterium]
MTFVVPVRNDAARLRRCLTSINDNQSGGRVEIVVADNCSTDESAAVARFAGATVLVMPGRVSELRNAAAAVATTDILAFVDADHVIDPSWTKVAVEVLREDSVGATGAPYETPPDVNWVQRAYNRFRSHRGGVHDVEWLGSGNLAIRRNAFQAIGGFDTSLETCEDVDLCNRLRLAGHRIVSDARLRSVHYGDPETLSALFFSELWRGRDNIRATLRGPLSPRAIPSLAIPVIDLLCLATVLIGALALVVAPTARWPVTWLVVVAAAGFMSFSLLRTARMTMGGGRVTPGEIVSNFAVACVYDLARALALVFRVTHQTRRGVARAA